MKSIRSFIAIPLAPVVAHGATRLIQRLQDIDDHIKWVPTDNLHLTLKFLGDVDNVELPSVCKVVRNVCAEIQPFELEFLGTGAFPHLDRPRVLYVGVTDATNSLCELVAQLELKLADLGFKQEPRDYTPHLTLGRTRGGGGRVDAQLVEEMKRSSEIEFGSMIVDELQIVGSFLDKKKTPSYQVMDTIEF